MKFQLTIECDNDAFTAFPEQEVSDILLDATRQLRGYTRTATRRNPIMLYDRNGNKVGEAYFTGRRPNA